jgi:hypothetical protein
MKEKRNVLMPLRLVLISEKLNIRLFLDSTIPTKKQNKNFGFNRYRVAVISVPKVTTDIN